MNYIIFDLEATCWKDKNNKKNEIIEIGAVKLNGDLKTMDTFSTFVRPMLNPILSEFCISLTSINQKDVDAAKPLNTILPEFEKWILSTGQEVLLCSWGFYDKRQLLKECKSKKYNGSIQELLNNHISVKHQFAEIMRIEPCWMGKALEMLSIPLEGTLHRGSMMQKILQKYSSAYLIKSNRLDPIRLLYVLIVIKGGM